jgi:glutamine amidotransferase
VEEHGRHVIVASEPTTYKKCEWELIEKNHAIVVDAEGKVELVQVTYPGQEA